LNELSGIRLNVCPFWDGRFRLSRLLVKPFFNKLSEGLELAPRDLTLSGHSSGRFVVDQ